MEPTARIYLDHNASSPLLPAAREAMLNALAGRGNASSVHAEGRQGRRIVEEARRTVAGAVGSDPQSVVFVSGATEAAAHALTPWWRQGSREIRFGGLYVSAVEHPAVLSGGRFSPERKSVLPVDADGVIDLHGLSVAMANHDASDGLPLVALMAANNETGVVQPVSEAAAIVHEHGGLLVVDAVQGLGKIDLDMSTLGADLMMISSHKVGGPQGAGALIPAVPDTMPMPLLRGGGQESRQRAGTENIAAIAGFGAAVAATVDGNRLAGENILRIRTFIEDGLRTICDEAGGDFARPVFFGSAATRLDNTSCFAINGIAAETALISLDLEGIALSSGSACSSGKVSKSHVLEAMGVDDDLASGALRLSLGPENTLQEARRFLDAMNKIVGQNVRSRQRMAV